MKGGGRGYYRNVSLLSVWAHAPFMHNNAIGPEICGKPAQTALDFYASPYVDAEGQAASPTRPTAGRSTRASRAATSSTRRRCGSC